MGMTPDEAKELLTAAGVPDDRIDDQAIMIASAIGDAIAKKFATEAVKRMVDKVRPGSFYCQGCEKVVRMRHRCPGVPKGSSYFPEDGKMIRLRKLSRSRRTTLV